MSTLEEEQMRANQVELKERHEAYTESMRRFTAQLYAAASDNPVAQAVCDCHSIDKKFGTGLCTACIGNEYDDEWPCPTIIVVADALGIEVPIA